MTPSPLKPASINTSIRIASAYAAFALIAMAANIAAQDITIRLYPARHALVLSVLVGTAVGLAVKYVLDKRYIFRFRTDDALHDGRLFVLYASMGLITTAIFWGVEFAFHVAFGTDAMRYLGGAIGLTIGYIAKYRLDKRFVFRREGA